MLLKVFNSIFGWEYYFLGFLKLIVDFVGFVGFILFNFFVLYVENKNEFELDGVYYVLGFLFLIFIGFICLT